MIEGIDVSDNNRGLQWYAISKSMQFSVVKATESDDYRSKLLDEQDWQARFHGMEVAYYHYAQPSKAHWASQAQHFASEVDKLRDAGNPLALDLEEGTGDLTEWALNFAAAVEATCGRLPILYSSPAFIAEHLRPVQELARLPLWLASWGTRRSVAPEPWREVALWQWTDSFLPTSTSTAVDADRFLLGGRQEFRDLGVTPVTADLARIKVFLQETAATLDGWSVETRAGFSGDDRRREVADQMETRASEARQLSA